MSQNRKWFLAGVLEVMIAHLAALGIPDYHLEILREIQTFLAEE